ncbi:MAG: YihY/virulence factor BrkB family protein [Lacisediminihabitans sp.]
MLAAVQRFAGWVQRWRPVRVFARYSRGHGELLAGGMTVTALFSVFAALYVGFAIAGFFLESSPALRDTVVKFLDSSVPGLIDSGSGGAINLEDLFHAQILGWTGLVAVVVLTGTSLGWLASTRDAVRAIFDLPGEKTFFLLLKLKDLGLIVGFGAVTILSAALSVVSTRALSFGFELVGVGTHTAVATIVGRTVGLLIVLAIDTLVLAALFRVLAGVVIPWPRLALGSLLGGIALGILKVLGSAMIGGSGRNPLLASFAVIVGLLVWLNLVSRVILLAASWIAVDMNDHGLTGEKLAVRARLKPPTKRPRPRIRWASRSTSRPRTAVRGHR